MQELAKRAVACRGWRWMPGALECTGWRLIAEDSPGVWCMSNAAVVGRVSKRPALPDLTDPATLGCLLAIVREAWGKRFYVDCARPHGAEVWHGRMDGRRICVGTSEAEALVAALEAAP